MLSRRLLLVPLLCSWYAPDMILVRSDILAALQGLVRRSGNSHATTQHHALDSIPFLNLIVALTSNGTRLGEKKNSMAQPIVAHCRGGFAAPATSGQIWHTSVALSYSQHKD